jgi:drug/metabolite transporter (DMT)-like permease
MRVQCGRERLTRSQPTKVSLVPSFFRSQAAAYILLPLAAACWAGNHVAARMIAGHAPPATVSLLRWVVMFVAVSLIAWPQIRADLPKLRAKAGVMVFLALMGGAAFGTLQFVALQYTTALNMGVVGSVSPAFIVAASYLLFRDGLGPMQLSAWSCRSSACWRSSRSFTRSACWS